MKYHLQASFILILLSNHALAQGAPLDKSLKPEDEEEVSNVFREMGVVQKRAMTKEGRFLFSSYGSFDFSDGPYTNYSINLNPGYAVSDFFEVYANIAPVFIANPRSIVKTVNSLKLADGKVATIVASKPVMQYGAEIVWAPAYGKDSLGMRRVIRSDTFFKFGAAQVKYDTGSGLRFLGGIGKTYFFGKWMGLRVTVNLSYIQNTINNEKSFRPMALAESGLMFYL